MWSSGGWVTVLVLASACVTSGPETRPAPGTPPAEPFADGLAALAAADYPEATHRFADVTARYPALADYGLFFQARALARAGRPDDALTAARLLPERHQESVWAGAAILLTGELLRDSNDHDGARTWLARARAALPQGGERWARASIELAELEGDGHDDGAALALATEVRRALPRCVASRRARRLTDRILAGRPMRQPEEHVDEAEMRLREGDPAGARAEAEAALATVPLPPLAARALWTRAQAERALRLPAAEATCLTLARDLPDQPLAPRALLAAAGWRWNADDDAGALSLFRDLAVRFPRSPQAPEAAYGAGRIFQEEGSSEPARYRDAFATYTQLADSYPEAALAAEARWRAGWVRYLGGEFGLAERAFRKVPSHADAMRQAAEYWRGRALERLGRSAEAHRHWGHLLARHPTSYYAGLAAERLAHEEPVLEPPAADIRPPFPAGITDPHGERAVLLARLGLPRFARLEVAALRRAGTAPTLVLDAYRALGAPAAMLRMAREIDADDPAAPRPDLYPLGYWDAVRPAAETYALDPFLVVALIRQESLFDPDAVSPADAHGLMQLLPGTARELSRARGATPPTTAALHDPAINIGLGTALLARLRDQHRGSLVKALAAYNAGDDAVAKWERRYGDRAADEFVELISYRETRDYVKLVLRNLRVYRRLYGRTPAASPADTSAGSPPNAPFDMMTMTSPERAEPTR